MTKYLGSALNHALAAERKKPRPLKSDVMMKQNVNNEPTLTLYGESIVYDASAYGNWRIPVAKLAIMGEYTNPNGPYVDDYFFVFIVAPDHDQYFASFYSKGREQFLSNLGNILGRSLQCGLCSSTDYNSNVIWPASLAGNPLFEFIPTRTGTRWKRLLHWVSPEFLMAYSVSVCKYLEIRDIKL